MKYAYHAVLIWAFLPGVATAALPSYFNLDWGLPAWWPSKTSLLPRVSEMEIRLGSVEEDDLLPYGDHPVRLGFRGHSGSRREMPGKESVPDLQFLSCQRLLSALAPSSCQEHRQCHCEDDHNKLEQLHHACSPRSSPLL